MKNTSLIWDLPVRLFHWLLAAGAVSAAIISLLLGEHSPLFPYHGIIGLTLALMVLLRIVWGFIGTRHARFSAFLCSPASVIAYLKGILTGAGPRHISHNPASAYAIVAMLALVLALATTGFLMATGNKSLKDLHEILAYTLLGVIGAHILGVAIHTIRHRDNITGSMIHGRKNVDASHAIRSAQPIAAAAFLIITGWWALSLVRSLDTTTNTARLPILGITLQLGENERKSENSKPTDAAVPHPQRDRDDD